MIIICDYSNIIANTMSEKTPMKWYIGCTMLFNSMDFGYTEGGYYSILTTDEMHVVWKRRDVMKDEFRDKYKNCRGAGSSRTIISIIREDGTMEKRYDDDELVCDGSLQTVISTDSTSTMFDSLIGSSISKFRVSESYVIDDGVICDSHEDKDYVSDCEVESKADEDSGEWAFTGISKQWGNDSD